MGVAFKKQLGWLESVSPDGVGLGPGVDVAVAESFVDRLCYGTTSRPSDYSVLWHGENLALVYWRGRDRKARVSSTVSLYRLNLSKHERGFRREVHDCNTTPPNEHNAKALASGRLWSRGRLTPKAIDNLVARAKQEEVNYLATVAAEAAKEEAEIAEREDRRRAEENAEAEATRKRSTALSWAATIEHGQFGKSWNEENARTFARLVREVLS